ncbi:MAG: lactonase family protein, partial [Planctomycetaceae bacterium]|nr:lactonase family protein [Planctomycetaceae bacterium]
MSADQRFYVGTYTRGDSISKGVWMSSFNAETGAMAAPVLAAECDSPSFLAFHASGNYLYVCNETNDYGNQPTGSVTAYRVNRSNGQLTEINQRSSAGGVPCHLNVDATGKFLLVANYTGGNVVVFPLAADGALEEPSCVINHIGSGPNAERQEQPHVHSVNLSADNRFAYVADLGIDRVMIYRFDAQRGLLAPGSIDAVAVAAGGGPRHFCIHPNHRFAWTNHELTAEVSTFDIDTKTGGLTLKQTLSTLPGDVGDNVRRSTSECLCHPNGRFVYVSNRGHESIAVFAVEQTNGTLKLVEITQTGGAEPRNFCFDPSGKWMLVENQNSDSVITFRVDPETGRLQQTDQRIKV